MLVPLLPPTYSPQRPKGSSPTLRPDPGYRKSLCDLETRFGTGSLDEVGGRVRCLVGSRCGDVNEFGLACAGQVGEFESELL